MGTVAVDFDGVIHAYSQGWQGGACYDAPVPGALDAVRQLQGCHDVIIFTARDNLDDVREWLARNDLSVPVTNVKPLADVYIDDRAVRFEDWDQALADVSRHLGGGDGMTGKSARTPQLSTEHNPLGTEGLWHTPSERVPEKQQLPALMPTSRISPGH